MIVGMTSGCFDLFHHSHLLFLERCRAQCDRLIVGVDSNDVVKGTKGEGRPIHDEIHRLNLVNSLNPVGAAFILNDIENLTRLAWDFNVAKIFKCERFRDKHVFGTEHGAELIIVQDLPDRESTSDIIEKILQQFSKKEPGG